MATIALATGLATTLIADAQTPVPQQVVKPPVAQLWMDVATISMPGMEGMGGMAGMMAPGLSALGLGGAGGGSNGFGNTRGMTPGRFVDIALYTQRKPAGTEGAQAMPEAAGLPPAVKLLPPPARQAARSDREGDREPRDEEPEYEKPRGRVLFYWGCGEAVRAGQPKVVDFARSAPSEWGAFMQGRAPRERGAVSRPGRSLWPNDKDRRAFTKKASIAGQHAVTGEGVPEGLKFALGAGQDFMPAIALAQSGDPEGVIRLQWQQMPQSQGFFINAMGFRENADGSNDMILWSSAEVPEVGMGLIDYASPANINQWLKEKVLLPPSTTACPIPKGAFSGADGAMLRMIAYGTELNLAYPARPADPKIPWEPEWAVRVRNKSATTAFLGESMGDSSMGGHDGAGDAAPTAEGKPGCAKPADADTGSGGGIMGGLGRVMAGAAGGLGGLLGGKKKDKKETPPDCQP